MQNIITLETKKYSIKLDNFELKVIINSLNEMRTKLLNQKKDTDLIDELLLKYITILEK